MSKVLYSNFIIFLKIITIFEFMFIQIGVGAQNNIDFIIHIRFIKQYLIDKNPLQNLLDVKNFSSMVIIYDNQS